MTKLISDEPMYTFPPKQGGDPIVVKVLKIERVKTEDPEKSYKDKTKAPTGYYDLIHIEGGEPIFMSTWALYFKIKEAGIELNDIIKISHPGRGEYAVEKVDSLEEEASVNESDVVWDEEK